MLTHEGKRPDIQGLRAWAVIFVVIAHISPTAFPGGFIGVDIFFVISGLVITQQMIRLKAEYPKQFLAHFYARRVRRILPSAILVLLLSFFATSYFLGVVAENDFKGDAGWVALFLANFHFQTLSLDYFAVGMQASPLQHYWSLAIEEQFYLVWPALFLLLTARRTNFKLATSVIATLVAISLIFSIYSTEVNKSPQFFNSFTRVWELGAGVLLALISKRPKLSITLELALLGSLILMGLYISSSMQWPRRTAVPVILVTSILLLRADTTQFSILKLRIFTYLGDLSFLIYLFHWPILIIVKSVRVSFDNFAVFIVLALTLFASILTHYIFEKPLRNSQLLIRKPLLTVSSSLIAISALATYFITTYNG